MDLKAIARRALPVPAYRMYRRWRVQRMVAGFAPRLVTHVYGGVELRIALEDPLGEGWYDHDWAPLPEITFLAPRFLRPGARVFDVGAHQGVVALMLADAVGGQGRVVAVEAAPHNARLARRNCELNGVSNVEVVGAAIASTSGSAFVPTELNAHVEHTAGPGLSHVPAVTIDELADRHGTPDVVLLDVEGGELAALRGATRTLREPRCAWVVEVHAGEGLEDAGGTADEVFDELRRPGHDLYAAPGDGNPGDFRPLDSADHAITAQRFFVAAVPA